MKEFDVWEEMQQFVNAKPSGSLVSTTLLGTVPYTQDEYGRIFAKISPEIAAKAERYGLCLVEAVVIEDKYVFKKLEPNAPKLTGRSTGQD